MSNDRYIRKGYAQAVIEPYAVVRPTVKIGEGTIIKDGAVIGSDAVIGKDCFISPNVSILFQNHEGRCQSVHIKDNVFVGANAVILAGVTICSNVVIGAGAVVTKNVTESGTYVGIPARKLR